MREVAVAGAGREPPSTAPPEAPDLLLPCIHGKRAQRAAPSTDAEVATLQAQGRVRVDSLLLQDREDALVEVGRVRPAPAEGGGQANHALDRVHLRADR